MSRYICEQSSIVLTIFANFQYFSPLLFVVILLPNCLFFPLFKYITLASILSLLDRIFNQTVGILGIFHNLFCRLRGKLRHIEFVVRSL